MYKKIDSVIYFLFILFVFVLFLEINRDKEEKKELYNTSMGYVNKVVEFINLPQKTK